MEEYINQLLAGCDNARIEWFISQVQYMDTSSNEAETFKRDAIWYAKKLLK